MTVFLCCVIGFLLVLRIAQEVRHQREVEALKKSLERSFCAFAALAERADEYKRKNRRLRRDMADMNVHLGIALIERAVRSESSGILESEPCLN